MHHQPSSFSTQKNWLLTRRMKGLQHNTFDFLSRQFSRWDQFHFSEVLFRLNEFFDKLTHFLGLWRFLEVTQSVLNLWSWSPVLRFRSNLHKLWLINKDLRGDPLFSCSFGQKSDNLDTGHLFCLKLIAFVGRWTKFLLILRSDYTDLQTLVRVW